MSLDFFRQQLYVAIFQCLDFRLHLADVATQQINLHNVDDIKQGLFVVGKNIVVQS